MIYKILCLGNQWRGSDDGSLFNAFSRSGHIISIIDHKMFISSEDLSYKSKTINKIFKSFFLSDFNKQIIKHITLIKPDIVCVYKGNCIFPETLDQIKKCGIPIFCVYPDVSFFDHESNIPKLIPYYDHIFTTKSFGVKDLKNIFNFTNVSVIKHSIDPNIHRKINLEKDEFSHFVNDVSFIGSYSRKKEDLINSIINIDNIEIKIWGGSWNSSKNIAVKSKYMNTSVLGDEYTIAIQKSKINLGILFEGSKSSSSGDLITSRTFHIPGAGGFMLHERTDELLEVFKEGVSVVCFENKEELNNKIKYYLKNESARDKIALKSYDLVWKYHKSDDRAKEIIEILKINNFL